MHIELFDMLDASEIPQSLWIASSCTALILSEHLAHIVVSVMYSWPLNMHDFCWNAEQVLGMFFYVE